MTDRMHDEEVLNYCVKQDDINKCTANQTEASQPEKDAQILSAG